MFPGAGNGGPASANHLQPLSKRAKFVKAAGSLEGEHRFCQREQWPGITAVERYSKMRPVSKNALHRRCEHGPGTMFHKDPHAVGIGGFHHARKVNGDQRLLRKRLRCRVSSDGVRSVVRMGVEAHSGYWIDRPAMDGAPGLGKRLHRGCVNHHVHAEWDGALSGDFRDYPLACGCVATDHAISRALDDKNEDAVFPSNSLFHTIEIGCQAIVFPDERFVRRKFPVVAGRLALTREVVAVHSRVLDIGQQCVQIAPGPHGQEGIVFTVRQADRSSRSQFQDGLGESCRDQRNGSGANTRASWMVAM